MSSSDQNDTPTTAQDAGSPKSAPPNLPPASFSMLVQMLATQCMAALGMIAGPDGKVHKEPAIAKHFVDLLSVLETKCKGNLDATESRMLDSLLHDLRMAYVQSTK
ncbi:MAG TPA: DUF1844 domain-containing protein [Caulifigura sp.]|jgi:hypothetical protein|nr:DUF1844 domain-containing protein [Caulifigura sp.]